MSIPVSDKFKPKGIGGFALVDAVDVEMPDGTRLSDFSGSAGQDGLTPYIGSNGNWWIGETDTGTKAQGEKGEKGDQGIQGIQGIQGEKGAKGDTGSQGAKGDAGAKGDKGDKGDTGANGSPGAAGKDGVSPTVSITTITGGHRVSITDVSGTKTFDVMDGEDGEDGTGGSITVDSELSDTSENPVQNKVITVEFGAAIQDIFAAMDQLAAAIPTDDQINALIDAKLGVIENGTY